MKTDLEDSQEGDVLKVSAESQGMSPGPAWAPVWLNTGRSNERLLEVDLKPERRAKLRGCVGVFQLAASRAKNRAVSAEDNRPRVPQNTRRNGSRFYSVKREGLGVKPCVAG